MSKQGYKEALRRIEQVKENGGYSLGLYGLNLEEIPEEILELSTLRELDLRDNQIVELELLSQLSGLRHLNLSNNHILEIGVLLKLGALTHLDLSNNQIVELEALSKLSSLTFLYLRDNEITDLEILSNLDNLKTLDFRDNQITDFSILTPFLIKGISLLEDFESWNNEFVVGNNPLQHPPIEVLRKGNEAVLQYFKDLKEQGLGELNETKLIIVGEPEAGKSSLMEMLRDPKFSLDPKAESTLGINVKAWSFQDPRDKEKSLTANIWDFGGQQIQYMTHQFFLTPDSVYVLVCANDRKEAVNFRYWFKIIHLLGEKEGRYSPVLVVKNDKSDKFNFNFDLSEYKKMYPELQIQELEVNLNERNKKYEVLEESIQVMLSKLPMVNDKRPAKWSVIRDELRALAKKYDHIDFKTYAKICTKHGVDEEASQKLLSGYLHTIGNLLHFVDDVVLRDFIILNPQWAVDAVYAVLVDTEISKNRGRFKQEKLDEIWTKYSVDERSKLLNLMRKDNFEICYELSEKKNVFVAPQLLDDIRPAYEWDEANNLKFRFQYTFMPDGIITRFIVRLNARISEGLVWKKGVILEDEETKAEVVEEESKGLKVIDIRISGVEKEQKYLLSLIRKEIKSIHTRWFKNIDFEEMIPCNCRICASSNEPEYFKYMNLKNRKKITIECQKNEIEVNVSALLEGMESTVELAEVMRREFRDDVAPIVLNNNIVLPQTEAKTFEVPVAEIVKEEELPWYKEWWVYSLVAGVGTFLTLWFRFESFTLAGVVGTVVGYIVFNMNPKRRYMKMAGLVLGWLMITASPLYSLNSDLVIAGFKVSFSIGEPLSDIISLGFLGLIALLVWLDSKEK